MKKTVKENSPTAQTTRANSTPNSANTSATTRSSTNTTRQNSTRQAGAKEIGYLIKTLREERGATQEQFAKALGTSQSAVARMEKGGQNFTVAELQKLSDVLNHKLVSIDPMLDNFVIQGGHKLSGSIRTNYSKNGSVGLLCTSLVNRGITTLHGIARIEEVLRVIEVLESIGVKIEWIAQNSVRVTPPKKFNIDHIDRNSGSRTRSVLMLIGPLLHFEKKFSIPHAGGCNMGQRTIVAHRYGFENMGVKIKTTEHFYEISHKGLHASDIIMYEAGDTAVENLLSAAALVPEETTISFASANYMVQEVCFFLQKLGVEIEGVGTTTLTIRGLQNICQDIEYTNSEDPIESMMFISAAIVTESELTITRSPIDFLKLELFKLEKMGLKYKLSEPYLAENLRTKLVDVTIFPSKLTAPTDKIHPLPYPGLNMDNLPFFVPIATQATGTTLIHDWVFENRAIYYTELNKLGANIDLADPHRVYIHGPTDLRGADVICPPALRPAMIILIAMLAAEGKSKLHNIYPILRGYEEIAERLNSIGANIKIIHGF